jgi:hypothetical protein
VTRARRIGVGAALGATVAAAAWLCTYEAPAVVRYVDLTGREFHPAGLSLEQPWWSAPATVLVLLAGAAPTLRFVLGGRRLASRLAASFGAVPPPRRRSRASTR